MKIAIIGTRGIPNNYGGFEQLAEFLSLGLKEQGHDLYVYTSANHKNQLKQWKGINIIHQYDPEKRMGTVGQFIYDFNSILDSRKHQFDVILNLGYTSSSVWMWLLPKRSRIITNMDGLEWKRTKYSKKVQTFLKYAEWLAVKRSNDLVADSRAIQTYLKKKYNVDSTFIAYGAELFNNGDEAQLEPYGLLPYSYNMLIARMEPENNIEMILDGIALSAKDNKFIVVGNCSNRFGQYLVNKYKKVAKIVFAGPIYDANTIKNLRYYSNIYFHGHSVGGTNPSLLEAMGCNCLVAAHDNEFNRSVLLDDAFYFSSAADVCLIVDRQKKEMPGNQVIVKNNYKRVQDEYSWSKIVKQYENLMTR